MPPPHKHPNGQKIVIPPLKQQIQTKMIIVTPYLTLSDKPSWVRKFLTDKNNFYTFSRKISADQVSKKPFLAKSTNPTKSKQKKSASVSLQRTFCKKPHVHISFRSEGVSRGYINTISMFVCLFVCLCLFHPSWYSFWSEWDMDMRFFAICSLKTYGCRLFCLDFVGFVLLARKGFLDTWSAESFRKKV